MNEKYRPLAYFAAGAATLSVSRIVYDLLTKSSSPFPTPAPFPAPVLPASKSLVPYPPDALPNPRDIDTPYGRIHAFELGPANSTRKVLLIHGISASSISMHDVARRLAAKGSRVMVVDLFGRGWSSGPTDLPYDGRLYASLILMAITSSPISWTGSGQDGYGSFTLVGHSLGGGIVADFAYWFPWLVNDLILIAPAGMQRRSEIPIISKLMYTGWVPDWFLASRLARWLRHYPITPSSSSPSRQDGEGHSPEEAAVQEVADRVSPSTATLARQRLAQDTVVWQLDNNRAFLPSFISSMRYSPIFDQYHSWEAIGMRLDVLKAVLDVDMGKGEALDMAKQQGFRAGKVLLIAGDRDDVVCMHKAIADGARALGGDGKNIDVRVLNAGHDLTVTHAEEISDLVWMHICPEKA